MLQFPMIEILPVSKNKTAIVTLAIGNSYKDLWTSFAFKNWES